MWLVLVDLADSFEAKRIVGEEEAKKFFDKVCQEYPKGRISLSKITVEQFPIF